MAKAAFVFALRQRVMIPVLTDVQGVVTARTDRVNGESTYYVECLTQTGQSAGAWIGEADLKAANKTA